MWIRHVIFTRLGGWSYLVALLDDDMHSYHTTETTDGSAVEEEMAILVDEIQALSAMTICTAVGNLEEFGSWALEDVSSSISSSNNNNKDGLEEEAIDATQEVSALVASWLLGCVLYVCCCVLCLPRYLRVSVTPEVPSALSKLGPITTLATGITYQL